MDKKLVTINNLNRFKQCLDVVFQAIEESFIPVPEPLYLLSDGDVIENIVQDYDGNWYDGVVMHDQIWLKQNLKTTHYTDGTEIALGGSSYSEETPYRYYPNGNADNVNDYGYIYNWPAVMNGSSATDNNPSDIQGIAPTGWHVPSDSELNELFTYIGTKEAYILNNESTYIAKAVASKTGWSASSNNYTPGNNPSDNNVTNLSMVAAGVNSYGGSNGFQAWSYIQTTTEKLNDSSKVWHWLVSSGNATVNHYYSSKLEACAVRCVMDMSASDWFMENKGRLYLKNTSSGLVWSQLSKVAESGDYNDLLNRPTITSDILICNYRDNTMDKTIAEIYEASSSGKMVFCKVSNLIYILELSVETQCRFKSNVNSHGGMSFNWITGVNSNETDTWTFGSNPYVSQEVLWCTYSDANNEVSGLTVEQIIAAKNNNKTVCCKFGNLIYICTCASNSHIIFSSVTCGVQTSESSTDVSGIVVDCIVYSSSSQAWGKGTRYLQQALNSGTNIKTINNESILGSGNIDTSQIVLCNITLSENTYTCDKNASDIVSEFSNGKAVFFKYNNYLYYCIQAVGSGSSITIKALACATTSTSTVIAEIFVKELRYVNSYWNIVANNYYIQDRLVSGTNIKTINGKSILGSGDITTSYSKVVETKDGDEDVVIEYDGDLSSRFVVDNKANSRTVDVAVDYPSDILYLYESVSTYQVAAGRIAMFEIRKADDGLTCIVTRTDIGNKITL